jgi:inner membrane protein
MDPLTHTLVGANLAATRLGDKTRMAAAALVIGANLPDVDAILYFTAHDDLALEFRRGWTHGVLAMVVLPVIQALILKLIDRRADFRMLLGLSFLAILTHPTLDWLNNYGMRWLMPLRGTWFYGDAVYIMDPLLWLILGCGWLSGRRPAPWLIGGWLFFTAAISWVVARRNLQYLIIVAVVALVLLAALLWRAKRSYALAALVVAAVYIGARLTIHGLTAMEVRRILPGAERVMAAPHPIDPLRWDVVARTGDEYRYGRYTWIDRQLRLSDQRIPVAKESPIWAAAREEPSIRGFITWARFPWYETFPDPRGVRVEIHDARYAVRRRPGGGFGGVTVVIPDPANARRRK